jgi:hypothetical protein
MKPVLMAYSFHEASVGGIAIVIDVLLSCACIVLATIAWQMKHLNSKLRLEVQQRVATERTLQQQNELLRSQLAQAIEKLAEYENPPTMNGDGLFQRVVEGLVALGVPGLVLLIAVATSGFAGAAALTTALAALGGPFGMVGGIGVLLLLTLVSKALTRYGLPKLTQAVIRGLMARGESSASIREKFESLPKWVMSTPLRTRIEEALNEGQTATADLVGESSRSVH